MNMTREQLASWCALEGLWLGCYTQAKGASDFRILPIDYVPGQPISARILAYVVPSHRWAVRSVRISKYHDAHWTDLPEELYNSLTVELLLSIKA